MGDLIRLNVVTRLNLPVDLVLDGAKGKIEDGVMVIGWHKDGELYFASSIASGPESLWLLENAKRTLLRGYEE